MNAMRQSLPLVELEYNKNVSSNVENDKALVTVWLVVDLHVRVGDRFHFSALQCQKQRTQEESCQQSKTSSVKRPIMVSDNDSEMTWKRYQESQ